MASTVVAKMKDQQSRDQSVSGGACITYTRTHTHTRRCRSGRPTGPGRHVPLTCFPCESRCFRHSWCRLLPSFLRSFLPLSSRRSFPSIAAQSSRADVWLQARQAGVICRPRTGCGPHRLWCGLVADWSGLSLMFGAGGGGKWQHRPRRTSRAHGSGKCRGQVGTFLHPLWA